ncbi:hypothetical protein ACFX2G_020607 [Malus domestica]
MFSLIIVEYSVVSKLDVGIAEPLTVVKIDHDANPKLIEEYKVHGLPALILFTNGKEVPESRREGAIAKAKLQEYVDAFLESMPVA